MKKKITKKLIALISAIMICVNAFAQTKNDSAELRKKVCDDLMKHATYIFEGKLVSSACGNYTTSTGYMYRIISFEVQEVIKGSLKKGMIVERIEFIGNKNEDGSIMTLDVEDDIIIPDGRAIYFCYDDKNSDKTICNSKANLTPIKIWDVEPIHNNKIWRNANGGISWFFTEPMDLYQYLSKNYSLNIDKFLLEKKSPNTTQVTKKTTAEQNAEQIRKLKEAIKIKARTGKAKTNRTSSTAQCTDLLLSEVLDGLSGSNAIEIYNTTSSPITLTGNYSLLLYHSASYTATTIALTGTISAYGTFVVVQQGSSSAVLAHANQITTNLHFNNNVCIALNKGNTYIDIIGEIGVPNTSGTWTLTPTGGTNNSDIRRMYNIGMGDTSWVTCKAEWNVFSGDSINDIGKHSNICTTKPDPNLIFSLENPQTTGTSPKYFEFDVTIASNNDSSYLIQTLPNFQFNTSAFGTNIVTGGKVTVTPYYPFSDTSNYYTHTNDVSNSEFQTLITTGLSDTAWTLAHIITSPVNFLHVKIEVANCYIPANIKLVHPDSTQMSSAYFLSNYETISQFGFPYNKVSYVDSVLSINTCAPVITGFSSPSVIAGAYYTGIPSNESQLIIQGSGFGSSGTVLMKNAISGIHSSSHPYIQLDPSDITFWSSNQITVTVPSVFFNTNPDVGNYAGTGLVKIVNSSVPNDTAVSPTEIQ